MKKELINFVTYLVMSNKAIIKSDGHVLSVTEIQSEIDYYLNEIRGKGF